MITMGLGELVAACALMFMGFFGGEGGISTDRVIGHQPVRRRLHLVVPGLLPDRRVDGDRRRPDAAADPDAARPHGQRHRDNFERAQFVGYDPRMVRFLQFTLSGFFAGIARRALRADLRDRHLRHRVAAAKSANALLAVYIGGAGAFFGPILGTIVVVLLQSGVSLLSNAWLLYVGVLFIVMVMYAPGGIIGLVFMHVPIWRIGRLPSSPCPTCASFPPALLLMLGFVLLVELALLHHDRRRAGQEVRDRRPADRHHPAAALADRRAALGLGGLWLRREARGFRERWDALIEDAKKRGVCAAMSDPALELRDVEQELRRDRDHPRRRPRHPARRAARHHRPQRRRQDDAVQPDQRAASRSAPARSS